MKIFRAHFFSVNYRQVFSVPSFYHTVYLHFLSFVHQIYNEFTANMLQKCENYIHLSNIFDWRICVVPDDDDDVPKKNQQLVVKITFKATTIWNGNNVKKKPRTHISCLFHFWTLFASSSTRGIYFTWDRSLRDLTNTVGTRATSSKPTKKYKNQICRRTVRCTFTVAENKANDTMFNTQLSAV